MAVRISLQGRAVAYTAYDYDFVDQGTGQQVKGTSLTLFLSQSFDTDPAKIKVPTDVAAQVYGVEFGDELVCDVELFARGDQVVYRMVTCTVAATA